MGEVPRLNPGCVVNPCWEHEHVSSVNCEHRLVVPPLWKVRPVRGTVAFLQAGNEIELRCRSGRGKATLG